MNDTMEAPMADARDALVVKKRTLENDLRDLVNKFEGDTGLSITKIRLVRDEVTGNAKPVLQRTEATVELISG
jgi:hypothetical protein